MDGWPKIGLLFICLPAAALFSSNLPVSCQFREFLSLFNFEEHSFHQFQRLRRPGEQSILTIHFTRKSTIVNIIVFLLNWVILIILWLLSTQILETGHNDYLITIGLLWSRPMIPHPTQSCYNIFLLHLRFGSSWYGGEGSGPELLGHYPACLSFVSQYCTACDFVRKKWKDTLIMLELSKVVIMVTCIWIRDYGKFQRKLCGNPHFLFSQAC